MVAASDVSIFVLTGSGNLRTALVEAKRCVDLGKGNTPAAAVGQAASNAAAACGGAAKNSTASGAPRADAKEEVIRKRRLEILEADVELRKKYTDLGTNIQVFLLFFKSNV